ncbi:MAG: transaldolase [Trueperaceae bacterium]|nr:transaldolase [Trueperaceae bacterium]
MNPLARLPDFGQSVYVDEIRRAWLFDGTMQAFIDQDHLRGVTSNPAIFQKAIADSTDYDEQIRALAEGGLDVPAVYEAVVLEDIRRAADMFRPQWEDSAGRFGWVSLEVNPHLAHDTDGTIQEAKHLHARLDRPNVFIKVPGTAAGVPAIRTLLTDGVPINVTLLFGLQRYAEVHEAFLQAMEARIEAGAAPDVASVASFFLSRIDVAIDPLLDDVAARNSDVAARAAHLKGQIAVANAKLAYRDYENVIASDRWARLAEAGARPQRLLWASTSTKNPDYDPLMYVEPLIGPDTVNTMPTATLDAYRQQGDPAERIRERVPDAKAAMVELAELGIDIDAVTARLEDEGIDKFVQPFDALMNTLADALVPTG